jgi:hypothetical protein
MLFIIPRKLSPTPAETQLESHLSLCLPVVAVVHLLLQRQVMHRASTPIILMCRILHISEVDFQIFLPGSQNAALLTSGSC